jgi:hypothetical protein
MNYLWLCRLRTVSRGAYLHAFNANDTVGQSYGTMQVNDFWCLPSKYYPNGYMQAYGLLTVCNDLFDLETNMRAALNIYRYSNGWRAWSQ